ncbi:MAG: hypothetical protein KatS3mg093_354 [Candidatus Parcubacteria bacterium]|nr:MAG: hypothetical protein KatS3mg093_354 [Candidatus Parcubacteria bacterium]
MNWRETFKGFRINLRKSKDKFVFINFLLLLFLIKMTFLFEIAGAAAIVSANSGIVECGSDVCTWNDLSTTLGNLIRTVVSVSFWLAVILSVIGAFLIMLQGPKPDLYRQGVNMIKIAILAYVLLLLAGIIFDAILEFFQPKFNLTPYLDTKFVLANNNLSPDTYFNPLKQQLTTGLQCGRQAKNAVDKIIQCSAEAISALSNLAIILLGIAIFASGAYLISTPFFGLGNIPKAWKILIWSIVGLVIVLLANVIATQVKQLIAPPSTPFLIKSTFAQDIKLEYETRTFRVCPPSILGSAPCTYPSIQQIASSVSMFIINKLAPNLLVLLIILGGFFYLLSPFDIKNIQTGHNYIKWAIYGYFILLIITAVLSIISVFFGGPNTP